jgi:hypothetical protein
MKVMAESRICARRRAFGAIVGETPAVGEEAGVKEVEGVSEGVEVTAEEGVGVAPGWFGLTDIKVNNPAPTKAAMTMIIPIISA